MRRTICSPHLTNYQIIYFMSYENNDPVEYPIDGTLDLHQFQPKEVADVVREYINCCLEKKIYSIRIVHGKVII